jgi:L-alanine-DL-glutamate epimerase-like enolase superfamily enzyme
VRAALNQLAAVRSAVGEDIGICFDIHTRLDLPDAVWLCRESEALHPFFMEDALRSEKLATHNPLGPVLSAARPSR